MSTDQLTETVEADVEVSPLTTNELNVNKFQAIMQFSEQTEKIGRALDNIRKFTLSRALPGDWVRHGDNLNLSGPGAERILSALGLMGISSSFTGWKYWKDTGMDKLGDYYVWYYEATVQIGGLTIEKVQGRAGSRDKFFGYAHGAFKDLSEVKESDIRMAARRGVIKDGVKLALGLRSIPAESAAALGLDPSKIKSVEFGSGGNSQASSAPAAKAGTPLKVKAVIERTINKKDGTKSIVYVIEDENGTKYETFSDTIAKAAKGYKEAGVKAIFDHEPAKDPRYAPKLKSMSEANDSQPDPEPVG